MLNSFYFKHLLEKDSGFLHIFSYITSNTYMVRRNLVLTIFDKDNYT